MEIGGTRQIFPPGGAAAMPMVIGGSAEYELNHLGRGNSLEHAKKGVVSIALIYIIESSVFPKDIRSEGEDVRGSRHGT